MYQLYVNKKILVSLYIKFSYAQVNPVNLLSGLAQTDLWSFTSVTSHWAKGSTQNFQDVKY